MKVHLIKKQTIENYVLNNSGSRVSFLIWLSILKNADWNTPEDIKASFGSADLLGNGTNRVIFDIGGNKYRVICKYVFSLKMIHLYVCWMGTHAEYSKLCKQERQYTINEY